jgi:sugar fermentation stimulation protein A
MKFPVPPLEAKFLKRYKRFFADAELNGQIVVAHVPNTGSLKSVIEPGVRCLLSPAKDPERKLKFTLEALEGPQNKWVGVNTSWPNLLAGEAFEKGLFAHWKKFDQAQKEVKISKESRIDWMFSNSKTQGRHFVEVKNVTLAQGDVSGGRGVASFPDAVTERGQKHLRELMALVKEENTTAEIFFTVQRSDCNRFAPADEIDPVYGELLREAQSNGVRVTVALVKVSSEGVELTGETLPLEMGSQ